MNKNQIDLLLIIKTASILQKEIVHVPLNGVSIPFLITLYKHGIIQNFIKLNILASGKQIKILIFLRYFFNKSIIKNFKILSKPSLYLYLKFADIRLIRDKKHTLFLSTSEGIFTNLECKIKKLGGIVLFKC